LIDFQDSRELDVEAMIADVQKDVPEISPETTPSADATAPSAEPPAPTWNGQEWEFEVNGKKIFPDSREKARTWLSQGYNYSQRMGELKSTYAQRLADIEAKERSYTEKYSGYDRYAEIDQFAKTNPDWWKHVETSWQSRDIPVGVDPNAEKLLSPVLQRLQQTESVLQQWQQEKADQERQRQDQELDKEIASTREQYPKIDLSAVDPATGETLEYAVLRHANQLGITSFRSAFRDYFHDKLVELAKADALEIHAKEKQQLAKKGVLGTTPAPVKGQPVANHRGKSYDQITQEVLNNLGIT
jgi:hypothetical protein